MIGKIYEIVTEMNSERKQRRDKSEYNSRTSEWARMYLDKFENDLSNNGPHSGQFENKYGLRRGKSLTFIAIVLGIVTYLVCV